MGEGARRNAVLLELRRVVYRCELLQTTEFSDEVRQALWESVVVALADIKLLSDCHGATQELIAHERSRHVAERGGAAVVPDGVSLADLESGCLAPPYVDPAAARALAEALIDELS